MGDVMELGGGPGQGDVPETGRAGPEATEAGPDVGPRLRQLRQERGLSLVELSRKTGISVSTLSRLETGVRVPGLEHLVALARAHAVSLDDLVGVHFSRDPRLRFESVDEDGRLTMPLAAPAGGLRVEHAIIRPPDRGSAEPDVHVHGPDQGVQDQTGHGPGTATHRPARGHGSREFESEALRTHRGYVWMLVLEGAIRLVVGSHDLIAEEGEAAEFDTRVPHWIGPARGRPAHVLNVHGRDGQRIRVRARPSVA
ncbi:helix-turn-helix domain-containing protein [Brevibacterium senegalense]|uniref:helix-turn-helix domain-containing protein n=1 Tax=Brevibacterium senegalense TaxID=1033736 RepID=UPI001C54C7E8|nr:helix-turn-helix domain-containing protein [Brevibacterium senegalense]